MAVSTGQCSVFLPDPFSSFHVLKRGLGNSHYVAPYSLLHVSGHNFFHSLPFHRSVTLEEPLRPRLLRISGSWKRLPAPTLTPTGSELRKPNRNPARTLSGCLKEGGTFLNSDPVGVCLVIEEMREGVGSPRTATMGGCELGTEPESSTRATNALNH